MRERRKPKKQQEKHLINPTHKEEIKPAVPVHQQDYKNRPGCGC